MKRYYCDLCGTEIKTKDGILSAPAVKKLLVPIHVDEPDLVRGYFTSNGNMTSGRMVGYDACQKCYNDAMLSLSRKIKEIQNGSR